MSSRRQAICLGVFALATSSGCQGEGEGSSALPPAVTKAADAPRGGPIRLVARLSIARIVDDDPLLRDLEEVVKADETAEAAGVTVEFDRWSHDAVGDSMLVPHLVGQDRAALASYLGGLEQRHPELAPGAGQDFVFARVPLSGDGTRWRSYLVDRQEAISPREVEKIEVRDSPAGTFELWIGFMPADGAAFSALTAKTVGHKLAIMIGDRVVSAPLVHEPIAGNTVVVTPGGANDATRGKAEAEALDRQLRGG